MRKILVIILLLAAVLTGCSWVDPNAPTRPKLVVQVAVEYQDGAVTLRRSYTDDKKMRAVLDYLRYLDPSGTVDPAQLSPMVCQAWFELTYSDGTTKQYQQLGDRYLRCGSGKWRNIVTERAAELPLLLGMLESDEEF